MSAPKKLLLTLQGIVPAPPDHVAALILDRITSASQGSTVEIDHNRRAIAVQGGWWYRGETTITSHDQGSLVTQQIFNVARWMRWWVWTATRTPLKQAPAAFHQLVQTTASQLNAGGRDR